MSKAKKPVAKKKAAAKPTTKNALGKPPVYLVVRDAFVGSEYDGTHYGKSTTEDGDPNDVPVRAFAAKKAAQEFAAEQDEEIRRTFPPPLFAREDTDDENTFGPKLAARVKELGLPAFKPGKYDYESGELFHKWWAKHAANLSAEQRATLWEPFAAMTFHRVRTVEVEG